MVGTRSVSLVLRLAGGLVAVLMFAAPASAFAAADAYEPDNSAAAAKQTTLFADVVNANARVHTFTSATDQDWIKFKATAWKEYSVKVYSSAIKSRDAWVRVQVFRKSGTKYVPIKSESYLGDDVAETYDFVAPASTTVYIRFRPYQKTSGAAGKRYLVRVSTGFPKPTAGDSYEDADDTRAGARPLPVSTGFSSSRYASDDTYRYELCMQRSELHNIFNPVGNVDEDWYSITALNDGPHAIALFTGFFANRAVEMELYDAGGTKLGETASGGAVYKLWTWNNLSGTTYHLRVLSTDSGNGAVPYWYRIGLFTQ